MLRTAQKLGLRSNHSRLQKRPTSEPCPLCGSPAQRGADGWRGAITISALVPSETSDPAARKEGVDADQKEEAGDESENGDEDGRALAPLLCYGCLLVWQGAQQGKKGPSEPNVDRRVVLPAYVREAAERAWAAREHEEDEVVGEKTVDGSGLRAEVEQYLL